MQLNAPKQITWWICLILGALGVIGSFIAVPVISTIAFWLVVVGLGLLLAATVLPNL